MVFASIMIFYSCNRVYMALAGVREPSLETDESIYKRGNELGIEADKVIAYKDSAFLKIKRFTSNSIYVFDKAGFYLKIQENSDNPKCEGPIFMALEGIGPVSYFARDSIKTLEFESSLWQNLQTKSAYTELSPNKHDYTVVYYWNLFNSVKNNLKDIELIKANLNKNKSVNVHLILVNQDLRIADPTLAGVKLK